MLMGLTQDLPVNLVAATERKLRKQKQIEQASTF